MKNNEEKSKYIMISKCKNRFSARLTINDKPLDKAQHMIHFGMWLSQDMT